MMQVTFAELARVLQASASTVDAAEGHGCLCGSLCTSADYTVERWIDELIPEEDRQLTDGDERILSLALEDAKRSLRGDEMEFAPLLPDEDEPLDLRATALAQWCRGFLYGFGAVRPLQSAALPATVDEVLRDIGHIGGAEVDVGASGEEEEEAYAEVFEYLRAGVQLVHDELAALREQTDEELPHRSREDDRSSEEDQFH